MARSKLTDTGQDLISDSGATLWSFVKGEQLEFPVTLSFLGNVGGYDLEAVVVEADNVVGQSDKPTAIKTGGVQTILNVRVPTDRGNWQDIQSYNRDEVVYYATSGKYYKLDAGVAYVSAVTPPLDPLWIEYVPNIVNIQFPSTLAATWVVQASVDSPIYGFFELRVTEPLSSSFKRTWKPVRGMVQILFSPTDIVP
jgi:hypothetical protein